MWRIDGAQFRHKLHNTYKMEDKYIYICVYIYIFVSRVITTQESKFAKQTFGKYAYPFTARISIPAVHWLSSLLFLPLMNKDTLVMWRHKFLFFSSHKLQSTFNGHGVSTDIIIWMGDLTFFEPCTVIYRSNNNQQNAQCLHKCFNLIIVSLTCFEHPSVHPQEDLYIQFYGISVMHPYKQQSGQWQDVLQHILPSTRLLIWMHDRNTIKLHVQVFLRMNTWMFETCQRHYN